MKAVLNLVAAGLCLSACDGTIVFISTGPSPVTGASATVTVGHGDGGVLAFGTPTHGALHSHGDAIDYRLVPSRTGTLVLGVSWDKSHGLIDVSFASSMLPRPTTAPPFTARVPVQAGQTYVVCIADGAPGNDNALDLPFTVTANLE